MPDFDIDQALAEPTFPAFVYHQEVGDQNGRTTDYYLLMLGEPSSGVGCAVATLRRAVLGRQYCWLGRYNRWTSLQSLKHLWDMVREASTSEPGPRRERSMYSNTHEERCISLEEWWRETESF